MAKDDERPQFNPKHRIAGAIILVSLAVIFVPMLLDESTEPAENQSLTRIPERDAAETKVVVAPVTPLASESDATQAQIAARPEPDAKIPSAGSDSAKTAPESQDAPAKSEPSTSETKMPAAATATVEKKTADTAKAAKSGDAGRIAKGWVVQVGTFANADNAGRLREKLQSQGYSVNSESITVRGSKAVRLRVGPYRDKVAAHKVQGQLQKELSIQGVVLAYP